jgi:enamine deaminase RidA (YjgF/YER057c/UK114 family)
VQDVQNTDIVRAAARRQVESSRVTSWIAKRRSSGLCREEFGLFGGDRKPAWTLAPVPALALEGMLVEIDFIAVVPR